MLLIRVVHGTMATLANHGVVETLRINLSGNKAFVIAYAVANLLTPSAIKIRGRLGEGNCSIKADILDYNSGSSFTPSPPLMSPSRALFSQPALLPEIIAKLLDSVTDPFPFAYEWRHPIGVVECRS